MDYNDFFLVQEAKRQNDQHLAELLFQVIDYKILKESDPTDKKGKPQKSEKEKLNKIANDLRKRHSLSLQELIEIHKKEQKTIKEVKDLQSIDLTNFKLTQNNVQ